VPVCQEALGKGTAGEAECAGDRVACHLVDLGEEMCYWIVARTL
jgi:hypothetical protein